MIDMDILSLNELPDKTRSQRRSYCTVNSAAVLFLYISLDLLRDRDHVREDVLTAVESVIVHADEMILFRDGRDDFPEVCLPVTACTGKQHHRLAIGVTHFFVCHSYPLSTGRIVSLC